MNADAFSEQARQFKRHAARFEARIEPHPDHADQFRLCFPDAKTGLAVVDVSQGGLGLLAGILFPKNIRLTVHVDASAQTGGRELVIRAIVRRCLMLDHKPTYQVGLQFVDPTGADEQDLVRGVTMAKNEEKKSAGVAVGVA